MNRKPSRQLLLAKLNCSCVKCGSIDCLEVHHIIPLSQGGIDDASNSEILCHQCHAMVTFKNPMLPLRLDKSPIPRRPKRQIHKYTFEYLELFESKSLVKSLTKEYYDFLMNLKNNSYRENMKRFSLL